VTGIKVTIGILGTAATAFFGGFDKLLYALVMFLVIDYFTGVAAAYYTKTWNSNTGTKGIVKKVMFLVLVGLAATMDSISGAPEPYFRTMIIWFLLGNEGISILENLGHMEVPIPSFLKTALEQLQTREVKK